MKGITVLTLAASVAATNHGTSYGGSGPYTSYYFEDATLPNHTLYQPLQSGLNFTSLHLKLPVIVWGNGACSPWFGLKFNNFLGEVASHGALAIATGPVFVDPEDYVEPVSDPANPASGQNPGAITAAIDWVVANAGKGKWKHVDGSRIAVWGQSCGGLEAYTAGAQDGRVGHLGIFNSGQISANASIAVASKITKPIFYFLGGPTDVAYKNGELDYSNLPSTTPAWKGNHELGHSVAFDALNGGIAGVAGSKLMQWLLRGDKSAKSWFVAGGANKTGFPDVVYRNLESIRVAPIQ